MFSNVPVMKISLADLQKLTEESQQPPEAAAPGRLGPPPEEGAPLQVEQRVPKKGTTPEQILASILQDFRRDELKEQRMAKKTCTKMTLPPFRGTRALREEELESAGAPPLTHRTKGERNGETEKNAGSGEEDEEDGASGAFRPLADQNEDSLVLVQEADSDKDAEKVAPPAHRSEASSSEEEEEDEEEDTEEGDSEEEEQEEGTEEGDSEEEQEEDTEEGRGGEENQASFQMFKPKEDEEQRRKDNLRRLAAIQQRQKVSEEHKKVIQSALARLVS